ncbi:aldo/keto reductase [Brachybacterium squillarum]|uniref:aldo/keto reductase n=1 Tax=Brachybacterium squillarum TaxID=661979 RepID=UPI001FE1E4C1|nr:aldo/keto reductase [Brachybacterium squillarum]
MYYWHRPDRRLRYADSVEALAALQQEGLIREIGISNADVEEIDVVRELRHCEEHGIAFVPWSPLGGIGGGSAGVGERSPAIGEAARAHGVSPQQVTLAWELSLGERVVPISGAGRPASILDSAGAMTLRLEPAELEAIGTILEG